LLVIFSVALKIDTKEIIKKRYLKNGFVIKPAPNAINRGVAKQCSKQIDELKIPIRSALLILVVFIIFDFF
jgi:hypothetical protein